MKQRQAPLGDKQRRQAPLAAKQQRQAPLAVKQQEQEPIASKHLQPQFTAMQQRQAPRASMQQRRAPGRAALQHRQASRAALQHCQAPREDMQQHKTVHKLQSLILTPPERQRNIDHSSYNNNTQTQKDQIGQPPIHSNEQKKQEAHHSVETGKHVTITKTQGNKTKPQIKKFNDKRELAGEDHFFFAPPEEHGDTQTLPVGQSLNHSLGKKHQTQTPQVAQYSGHGPIVIKEKDLEKHKQGAAMYGGHNVIISQDKKPPKHEQNTEQVAQYSGHSPMIISDKDVEKHEQGAAMNGGHNVIITQDMETMEPEPLTKYERVVQALAKKDKARKEQKEKEDKLKQESVLKQQSVSKQASMDGGRDPILTPDQELQDTQATPTKAWWSQSRPK